jgi:hypothetical protein
MAAGLLIGPLCGLSFDQYLGWLMALAVPLGLALGALLWLVTPDDAWESGNAGAL